MLSLDAQRRLTEFLGECWHESCGGQWCSKCRESLMPPEKDNRLRHLDFTDWRVVGRLIEKVECLTLGRNEAAWGVGLSLNAGAAMLDADADAPQLAVCLAIDAYLVAKGEEK